MDRIIYMAVMLLPVFSCDPAPDSLPMVMTPVDNGGQCHINWNQRYADYRVEIDAYRAGVQSAFDKMEAELESPPADLCRPYRNPGREPPDVSGERIGSVDLTAIPSLEHLSSRVRDFKYRYVPASGQPVLGTMIRLPGGPGRSLLKEPAIYHQWGAFDTIVMDDLGNGSNSFPIEPGDEAALTLENYQYIVEKIIERESLSTYIIAGTSYGTVSATVIGSYLSRSRHPPLAVVLDGVVQFIPSSDPLIKSKPLSPYQVPRRIGGKICVLPGENCHEDLALDLLADSKKAEVIAIFNQLYSSVDENTRFEDLSPMQRLMRDIMHMQSQQMRRLADFFEVFLVPENPEQDLGLLPLSCWVEDYFDEIPWLNRYSSPSAMAAIGTSQCFMSGYGRDCRCFSQSAGYRAEDFQIEGDTLLFYANGDADTQTPIGEALSHFQGQLMTSKGFLRVCGGGHGLIAKNIPPHVGRERKLLDGDEVFAAVFSGDIERFESIDGFCDSTVK